jgi:hypothetical protein
MEVQALEIDREEARKRVEEFTAKRRRNLTEMDRALFRGYKALAEGLTLIDVNHAIKQGGHFENNYCPKLAIARSDLETIHFDHRFSYDNAGQKPAHGGRFCAWEWSRSDKGSFYTQVFEEARATETKVMDVAEERGLQISLEPGVIDSPESERRSSKRWYKSDYSTIVPPVPFHLRPNGGDADKYFIMWEVEEWKEHQAARAPGDPFLLERIAHPIYVVVAQWDLSELEKRILESFRRPL